MISLYLFAYLMVQGSCNLPHSSSTSRDPLVEVLLRRQDFYVCPCPFFGNPGLLPTLNPFYTYRRAYRPVQALYRPMPKCMMTSTSSITTGRSKPHINVLLLNWQVSLKSAIRHPKPPYLFFSLSSSTSSFDVYLPYTLYIPYTVRLLCPSR